MAQPDSWFIDYYRENVNELTAKIQELQAISLLK
jgi:hypothetical protein